MTKIERPPMLPTVRGGIPVVLGDRRVLHPGRRRWLRALVWMVGLVFAVALVFGLWLDASPAVLPTTDAGEFAAKGAGAVLALTVYGLLVWLVEGRRPTELGPRGLPGLAVGLLLGLLMMSLVMAILTATGLYRVDVVGWAPAWRAAGLAIQAGVVEELIVRGILLRLIWRAFGPWVAFVVSAVVFGAGHLSNDGSSLFAAFCVALEAGVMLGAFYALTGRLWVSIGVHMAWNFAQGYLFGAAVSGGDTGPSIATSTARSGAPEVLTGGGFGPEASLVALVVCTAVGLVTLFLAWRLGRFKKVV
ncbi:lysostaphin resistance A-like protein [Actinoplanes sp. NPDC051494]|uniref:lysostaphin resistance A-like protein n=1 Tax=Actinoplanes sp. NPDC051494 TaxID=3363907 RepID=UPI0037B6DB0F